MPDHSDPVRKLVIFAIFIPVLGLGHGGVSNKSISFIDDDIITEYLAIDSASEDLLKEVPQEMKIIRDPKTNLVIDYFPPDQPSLPKLDPRDTHLPEFQTPEMAKWKRFLARKLNDLKENRNIWIDGKDMRQLLLHLFGATEDDLNALEHAAENMNNDPALKFRKNANVRLGLDLNYGTARSLERSPYVLTAKEGFKRHDAGSYRFFGDVQDWVVENTAFKAIVKFKSLMMYNVKTTPRPGCDPNAMINQNFFFTRVISTPKLMGEPATEGVHQDGVEFTMTTLLKTRNVDFEIQKAAVSKLFDLNQNIGVAFDKTNASNVVTTVQHRHFLDTLLFVDNELRHAVSPLHMTDPNDVAYRDIIVVFSRRMAPNNSKFISAGFDSVKSHPILPSAFGLKSKHLMDFYPLKEDSDLLKKALNCDNFGYDAKSFTCNVELHS